MRPLLSAFRASVVAVAAMLLGSTAQAGELRGVVELFTSQGCSSCPPADRLIAAIARESDVLVFSLPVDYWDYMGWKDTLASPAFTARQKSYSLARGDGQVYTPQAIIDGREHAVGSDEAEIRRALTSSGALPVPIKLATAGNKVLVELGAPSERQSTATLWLLRIARTKTIAIGRGENAGRTVTYTNVVRSMHRIGDWAGNTASFQIPMAATTAGDGDCYAVVLQAGTLARPGAILAAAKGVGM